MNIVRNGVILAVYTFSVIIAYIVLSDPAAILINGIAAASDAPNMPSLVTEVKTVLSLCFALAVIIPSVLFIWMAYTDTEIIYR